MIKAFYKVDHEIQKLKLFVINGKLKAWIKEFLLDRDIMIHALKLPYIISIIPTLNQYYRIVCSKAANSAASWSSPHATRK